MFLPIFVLGIVHLCFQFDLTKRPTENTSFPYGLGSSVVVRVSNIKDLGVIIDSNILFIPDIVKRSSELLKMEDLIIRICRSIGIIRLLYFRF